jgi:hypothetical protein
MTRPSLADYGTHDESAFPHLWDGVVGAWCPSLGPTGLRLHDFSRRANWGTLTNMDAATDWVVDGGQCGLDFDGVNDRVLVPNSSAFAIPKDIAVSFWVNTESTGANVELIQKMGAGESRVASSWEAYLNITGTVWFRLNGTENNLISTSNLPLSQWVNVVCQKKGATIALFFNAAGVGTLGGQPDINISTGSLTLGAYPDGSFPIRALFDDIRIYDRALSQNELTELYQIGRGGTYTPRRRRRAYSFGPSFQAGWARGSNVILQPCGVS